MLIETRYPNDAVYQHLMSYDVAGFMQYLAKERHDAGLPPFTYHALIHAESKQMSSAIEFLSSAKEFLKKNAPTKKEVTCFDPVPKSLSRVGGKERAQLLIEAVNRAQLQAQLNALDAYMRGQSNGRLSKRGAVRWSIERDPLLI
jgi:primosomal protein N' (replication factor Y)